MEENKTELKFWKLNKEQLLKHYNQRLSGYTDAEVESLRKIHGLNELEEEEGESIWEKITEQFQDTLVRILLLAAVVSFVIALTDSKYIYIVIIIHFNNS